LFAGQEVALLLDMPERELKRMSIEVASENVLVAEREGEQVAARLEPIVYDRNLRIVGAEVDHSLYMAAQSQGVPDKIISDVADILGWEIDFGRELDQGARVRVVYEELTRLDTAETIPGRVLAVAVDNRGERVEGFFYKMPDGSHAGYYNREGEGLGRAFLRYPVSYSRISSQFSTKRFHPVLKRNVPHYGVDFAAPTGTPVKAVADGTVLMAGWHGGNGRFVKIRHDAVYESGYAHLSRIAAAVKNGAKVKQGQVIGYVGSTGLATGPHLHFALYRSATYVDPLKADLPRPHALSGNALAAFRMTVAMMDRSYANAGHGEDATQQIVTAAVNEEQLD
jgi:murein DD-endopeptidase MepM/ murein hydrolase activator NlpD